MDIRLTDDFINFLKAVDELNTSNDKKEEDNINILKSIEDAKKKKEQEDYEAFLSNCILEGLMEYLSRLDKPDEARKNTVFKKNKVEEKCALKGKKRYIRDVEFMNNNTAYVYFTDGSIIQVGNFNKDKEKAIYVALSAKLLAEKGYDINDEINRFI